MRFIILILISVNAFGQVNLKPNEDSLIVWGERKLVWEDFMGISKEIPFGSEAISVCHIKIDNVIEDDSLYLDVYSVFNKKESWVAGEKIQELLDHEQLHFDITELFSRKIYNLIRSEFNKGIEMVDIVPKVQQLMNEAEVCQIKYDQETSHGSDKEKQEEWRINITDSLRLYEKLRP